MRLYLMAWTSLPPRGLARNCGDSERVECERDRFVERAPTAVFPRCGESGFLRDEPRFYVDAERLEQRLRNRRGPAPRVSLSLQGQRTREATKRHHVPKRSRTSFSRETGRFRDFESVFSS